MRNLIKIYFEVRFHYHFRTDDLVVISFQLVLHFTVVVDSMTGTMHKQSYERIFSGISDTQKKTFIAVVAGLLCLFKAIFRVPEHQRKPEVMYLFNRSDGGNAMNKRTLEFRSWLE